MEKYLEKDIDASETVEILKKAYLLARNLKHQHLTPEHVFQIMLQEDLLSEILESVDIDQEDIKIHMNNYLSSIPTSEQPPEPVLEFYRLVQTASAFMLWRHSESLNAIDLFLAYLREPDSFGANLLQENDLEYQEILDRVYDEHHSTVNVISNSAIHGTITHAKARSFIEEFCTNLNVKSQQLDMNVVGRESEIRLLMETINRRNKNNAILVGDAGVGKTAIVEGLARLIVSGKCHPRFKNYVIYEMDMGHLVAGTKYRGEFEERVKNIIDCVSFLENETGSNAIKPLIFIDEIHTILGAGTTGHGSIDVANLLKPALARGQFRCVGATTHEEYQRHFEKDKALNRRFTRIDVQEPTLEQSIEILKNVSQRLSLHHNVKYETDAIMSAAKLSHEYIHNSQLPDKAIDILDRLGSRAAMNGKNVVALSDVEQDVAEIAHVEHLNKKENNQSQHIKQILNDVIFGQSRSIDQLVEKISVSQTGLKISGGTLGCFMFVGRTGTGKTELSRQMARCLGMHYFKIDMSEYSEAHSVSKLVGSPPGYVGFEEHPGILVREINKHRSMVLVLDEIEKAHPSINNILLQILDCGTVQGNNGVIGDFRNSYVIITSNLGADKADRQLIGIGSLASPGQIYYDAVKEWFTPEFVNRLDRVIVFDDLSKNDIRRIAEKYVEQVRKLSKEKGIDFYYDDALLEWFVEKGYNKSQGARPMIRCVEQYLSLPVSELLMHQYQGCLTIKIHSDRLEMIPTG